MATLVTFHAHPDDEAITCGGTMAIAAAAGHRVVLVMATAGECGEVPDGILAPGETLGERRAKELSEAAAILGVARVEFLGYRDSGMIGTKANQDPGCFWQTPVDEAAARLARILAEERPDVFTVYDEHGNYGHPDHIQVHRVGVRAAEMSAVERVYESTINRDHFRRLMARATELGFRDVSDLPDMEDMGDKLGLPEELLTTAIDVSAHLDIKRRAMAAHASQIAENSFFLAMPPVAFAAAFGTEWFRLRGAPPGIRETEILPNSL
ncbi:MAG TPA: PIG-L family deacetylase [Acidimicrobiia bacterium]|nr:PIG-L family deacetylase [Acidimicrobiia bacterium]